MRIRPESKNESGSIQEEPSELNEAAGETAFTAQSEIEAYLEGLVEGGDMDDENDPAATYYFITTKEPNNMAADSMLNRAFGKPTETHEISGPNGGPITVSDDKRKKVNDVVDRFLSHGNTLPNPRKR